MKTMPTRAEKEQRVLEQLRDPLTANNTDATIARFCRVTPEFVKKIRVRVQADGTAFQKGTYHAVPIESLRLDGGTQPRAKLDKAISKEYRDDIKAGAVFPPIGVVYDGADYWVWDGFHRVDAHRMAGRTVIQCEVRQGTRRDGVLLAAGANSGHGVRRTNEDKRRAVQYLLEDPEWQQWSDQEIARRCGVSHPFVATIRQQICPSGGNGYHLGADGKRYPASSNGQVAAAKPPEPSEGKNGDAYDTATSNGHVDTLSPPMRPPVVVEHKISVTLNGDPDADYARLCEQYPSKSLIALKQLIVAEDDIDASSHDFGDLSSKPKIINRLRRGPATAAELNRIALRFGARIWELNRSGYQIERANNVYTLVREPASQQTTSAST